MTSLQNEKLLESLENKVLQVQRVNREKFKYRYQQIQVKDWGISTPDRLLSMNTVLGWAGHAVDVLIERLSFRGFWSPEQGQDELVGWLNGIYNDNAMETAQSFFMADLFTAGTSYFSVGAGDPDKSEAPILWRPESPSSTFGHLNPRTNRLDNSLTLSMSDDREVETAVLYLPHTTQTFKRNTRGGSGKWLLHSTDTHNLGRVPMVTAANAPDSNYPRGRSVISPALRGFVDAGMETLLNAGVIREFTAGPIKAVIGMDQADLIREDGTEIDRGELLQSKLLNLPYNSAEQVMPQLVQLQTQNPQVVFDMLKGYAKLAAQEIGVPASDFGFETVNPTSADAIRENDKRIIKRASAKLPALKQAYSELAELSMLITDTPLPDDWTLIEPVFSRVETTTPQAAADRVIKMQQSGVFDTLLPLWVYRDLGLTEQEIKETQAFIKQKEGTNLIESLISLNETPSSSQEA